MRRLLIALEAGFDEGVINAVEFKREEEKMRGKFRQLRLNIAEKLAVGRVRRIGK